MAPGPARGPESGRNRRQTVDVRQLDALLAVAEEGSFTSAADRLRTVQSNVSEHVRQLEAELGVQLLVRNRRGAVPTEFGARVIERARAIRSEIEALHKDLTMLQGLETGHATLGVVGTVSRLLVPQLVAEIQRSAPGVSLLTCTTPAWMSRTNESARPRSRVKIDADRPKRTELAIATASS